MDDYCINCMYCFIDEYYNRLICRGGGAYHGFFRNKFDTCLRHEKRED